MSKKDPLSDIRRERFRDWCRDKGLVRSGGKFAVSDVAKAIGKGYQHASNLLNGHGSFGATIAREIEEFCGLPANYFDGSDEGDFVDVPRIDVAVAAGDGSQAHLEDVIGHLKFSRGFLRGCGVSPVGARVVDVKGPSMEPTIKDGAVLLVSTNNREPVENQVFAMVRPVEGLIVKRLVRKDGHWVARSDNRDFPDILIDNGEPVTIIGRAIWMGAKL